MVMQLAARDLNSEECEALIRRGAPRNLSIIKTLHDWRALQAWAASRWDLDVPESAAKTCLHTHRHDITKVLKAWAAGRVHDYRGWSHESTIECWLRMRVLPYASKSLPFPRPTINPRRVNYPPDGRISVVYAINAHPTGGMTGGNSFDNAVRVIEERRTRLANNEILI